MKRNWTFFEFLTKCQCQITALMQNREFESTFRLYNLSPFSHVCRRQCWKQMNLINEAVNMIFCLTYYLWVRWFGTHWVAISVKWKKKCACVKIANKRNSQMVKIFICYTMCYLIFHISCKQKKTLLNYNYDCRSEIARPCRMAQEVPASINVVTSNIGKNANRDN